MSLRGAVWLGAWLFGAACAAAAPQQDPRFTIELPPQAQGEPRTPAQAAQEALPLLWRRLLPQGAQPPQAMALGFVARVVPLENQGVRVVFRKQAVLAWLRAHAVPFFAQPVPLGVRVRVLDAFGPRPDWEEAARTAIPLLTRELGIAEADEAPVARLTAYVRRGELVLATDKQEEEQRIPVPQEARLSDPAFWHEALAPVLMSLRDRMGASLLVAAASSSQGPWACIRLRFARAWTNALWAQTSQLLAAVPGVQASLARIGSEGITYRLQLAEPDALARLQRALRDAGWALSEVPLGLEAR